MDGWTKLPMESYAVWTTNEVEIGVGAQHYSTMEARRVNAPRQEKKLIG